MDKPNIIGGNTAGARAWKPIVAPSRRHFLALVPAVALAGCGAVAVNTVNGVTTVNVNVAEATADLSGLAAAAAIFVALPGVGATLGPAVMAVAPQIIARINAAIPALQQAAGGSQTFTFDTSSAPAFVKTLLADAQALTQDAVGVLPAVGSIGAAQNVGQYAQAVQALGNAIVALFGGPMKASVAFAAAPPMSRDQALALVGIRGR